MQQKFLRNLALLLVLNLLIKPFWIFGIDRTVQNTVGANEYGFYFAVFNFSFLFYILLDFGITTFNNKNIAQNEQLLRKHMSNILVIKLFLLLVYMIFTIGSAFFICYSETQIKILFFLGINQFLISFILYLRSNLSGLHFFKTDSFISVLDRLLMIIICSILLWGGLFNGFNIEYFVYAQTLSLTLTTIITFLVLFHKAKIRLPAFHWNYPFYLMILRQSFPFAILVLLMTFYNRIDSVMLERMLGSDGTWYSGIYASAYRLLDASNMLAYLFAVLLLPIFARMLKQKQSVEELIKLSYTLLIVPAIMMAVASFCYASDIMKLLYPIHEGETIHMFDYRIAHSSKVFGLLMTSFCAIATMYIFSTLLTANGNLKHLNIVALIGMAINIGLNLWLIPVYKAYGSAIATVSTQFLISSVQVFLVVRYFRFKVNYRLIFRLILFLALTILLGFLSIGFTSHWVINILLFISGSFLLAVIVRLLQLRYLYNLLSYGEG